MHNISAKLDAKKNAAMQQKVRAFAESFNGAEQNNASTTQQNFNKTWFLLDQLDKKVQSIADRFESVEGKIYKQDQQLKNIDKAIKVSAHVRATF